MPLNIEVLGVKTRILSSLTKAGFKKRDRSNPFVEAVSPSMAIDARVMNHFPAMAN
jgi:hypothetical protein